MKEGLQLLRHFTCTGMPLGTGLITNARIKHKVMRERLVLLFILCYWKLFGLVAETTVARQIQNVYQWF